ncbi:unnamed protein product, partial [Penicillium salamii]
HGWLRWWALCISVRADAPSRHDVRSRYICRNHKAFWEQADHCSKVQLRAAPSCYPLGSTRSRSKLLDSPACIPKAKARIPRRRRSRTEDSRPQYTRAWTTALCRPFIPRFCQQNIEPLTSHQSGPENTAPR